MVMPTQAEKNRAAAEAEKLKAPPGPTRLYVGSLHFNINEQMIKAIFEPFGTVESVQMIYDSETGRSKGYGFLQFKDADAARQAMDQMNGFELAGRPMKVGPVTERGDSSSYSFLDDEEYEKGGVELNSTARAALMAKLSQGHSAGVCCQCESLSVKQSKPGEDCICRHFVCMVLPYRAQTPESPLVVSATKKCILATRYHLSFHQPLITSKKNQPFGWKIQFTVCK